MVQLLQPQQVKLVTKDGECKISLTIDLNINLNQNEGLVKQGMKHENEPDDDEVSFVIPDFEGSGANLDFGKQEEAR